MAEMEPKVHEVCGNCTRFEPIGRSSWGSSCKRVQLERLGVPMCKIPAQVRFAGKKCLDTSQFEVRNPQEEPFIILIRIPS